MNKKSNFIRLLHQVSIKDLDEVGGKNAALGEMIQHLSAKGINIPGGYVVTTKAYKYFIQKTGLAQFIKTILKELDPHNLVDLKKISSIIRKQIEGTDFPPELIIEIIKAHQAAEKRYGKNSDFAVRSSATTEDLPGASFAGEHETFLNIRGEKAVLKAIKGAISSLFTDRAISYRVKQGFEPNQVDLAVGIQKMVRSDKGSSGVLFTLDPESGFADVVLITGLWGLGELLVQGKVTPDEFIVSKQKLTIIDKKLGKKDSKLIYGQKQPTQVVSTTTKERMGLILTDKEIMTLTKWALLIENHYNKKNARWTPMDIEWAKDGLTGKIYIVQARPETVHANKQNNIYQEYNRLEEGNVLVQGVSAGNKIAIGPARVIKTLGEMHKFRQGEILITNITSPDWSPILSIAAGIVTNKGGRTSHAAIVSRELGIPAVLGCGNATEKIKDGQILTLDCTRENGMVYEGSLKFQVNKIMLNKVPKTKTKIMMNIATPQTAFEKSFLPNQGVGLMRQEFIIGSEIGIHPLALVNYQKLPKKIVRQIDKVTVGYPDKTQFFVDKVKYGIAKIATAFYPKEVIIRFSDFKSNEYRDLIGGEIFEPNEENPMLGLRGASRYYFPEFIRAFLLEVEAIKQVIGDLGMDNISIMVPFCRTPAEGLKVKKLLQEQGLTQRKYPKLKIYMMCEIPSNIILADQFLDIFDGMSIGSNDLTQLVLGIDRDANEWVRGIGNENNDSVKQLIQQIIKKCKNRKKYIGICGQAPSDYPEFTKFLVRAGIESISLNPDSIVKMIHEVAKIEQKRLTA